MKNPFIYGMKTTNLKQDSKLSKAERKLNNALYDIREVYIEMTTNDPLIKLHTEPQALQFCVESIKKAIEYLHVKEPDPDIN